jgi:IS30 family transposase
MATGVVGRPGSGPEVRERFWQARQAGLVTAEAAALAGVGRESGGRWVRQAGGIRPRPPTPRSPRVLSAADRDEIACGVAAGDSLRAIARSIGRAASTVSREVRRNSASKGYRASTADRMAKARTGRPKPAKLAQHGRLRAVVEFQLGDGFSPEQISNRLHLDYPDEPEMRVSHETIYQSLYVQSRGALKRELTAQLRTGRAVRRPKRRAQERRGRITDMVMISERPADADDRAVPGHWEGDLIIGAASASAVGTLAERTSRYCLLLHLPERHDATAVRDALTTTMPSLPEQLRRSLTWDQGGEMAQHAQFTVDTDIDVYFCDPHSPWQRATNENLNGLLRQYLPKGADLSQFSRDQLNEIAARLNRRPRKTLGWRTPAEALNDHLLTSSATAISASP